MPIAKDVKLGKKVKIYHPGLVNFYGCEVGDETVIGPFVEIQKEVKIGARCKISTHSFICRGVEIKDEVFVGHGVMFINDLYPRSTNEDGSLQTEGDWEPVKTYVGRRASIGSNATILGGINIGEEAIIGAGAVVTKDVEPKTIVAGNPARVLRKIDNKKMTAVPLIDLRKQHEQIREEVESGVIKILREGRFRSGEEVKKFEKAFAKYCQAKYCVGVGSGYDAVLLALEALGVGPGDEVITVPNTFISTVSPIIRLGGKPVFVDIDSDSPNIDVDKIEAAITKKTKAILPVHLYGVPAQMDKIMKIARKHKLVVVEDAAQAHGSKFKGKRCGSLGNAAAFSFYPAKNLGASGEAGAVVTNSKRVADKVRLLGNMGEGERYKHKLIGYNSHLDTIEAAVLLAKLKYLDRWNRKRRKFAKMYHKLLSPLPIKLPPAHGEEIDENFYVYVIRTPKRDELFKYLKENEVYCGIHYPIPLHLQEALKGLGYKKGDFPVAEKQAREILSLPMHPYLTEEEVIRVSDLIHQFFEIERLQ